MRVRFEDVEGNKGIVGEDLALVDYNGPDSWKVRIEDSLSNIDSDGQRELHGLESLEEEERMERLAEILPTLTLIESATVEE